jgi:putative transposase
LVGLHGAGGAGGAPRSRSGCGSRLSKLVSWVTRSEKVSGLGNSLQSPEAGADKLGMATKPRCVLPGTIQMVTRRCSERRFFLLPELFVTQTFEYLLGHFSQKYGIAIHAFVAMSNHYHLVVTDVEGRLPDFERDFNSMLARALNWHWKRWEAFWDRESYSGVKLLEDQDVISKIGYVLANPVKARLVGRAREWEGATSAGMAFGHRRRIQRPDRFFREESTMPEEVDLVLTRPAGFEGLNDREVLELVRAEVGRREALHREKGMARKMREVFEQEWWECPASFDPRRKLRPTVAGKNKWVFAISGGVIRGLAAFGLGSPHAERAALRPDPRHHVPLASHSRGPRHGQAAGRGPRRARPRPARPLPAVRCELSSP